MKKIVFTFFLVLIVCTNLFSQSIGDYQTRYTDYGNYEWSNPANWQRWNGSAWGVPSVAPDYTNNVTIRTGSLYYFDDDVAECKNLTIQTNSELFFYSGFGGGQELWIEGNVSIASGGFLSTVSDEATDGFDNAVYVAGNVINNGDILLSYVDESTGAFTYADLIVYTGSSTFTTSVGSVTDLASLILLKNFINDTLKFIYNGGDLKCEGYEEFGFLHSYESGYFGMAPTGTFLMSGTSTLNYPLFHYNGAEYGVGTDFRVVLDNPNFTIQGANLVYNSSEPFKIKGEFVIKNAKEVHIVDLYTSYPSDMVLFNGGKLTLESGASIGVYGSLYDSLGVGEKAYFNQSGYLWVGGWGSQHSTKGALNFSERVDFTMSGGGIYLTNEGVSYPDYNVQSTNFNYTGGYLQGGGEDSYSATNWVIKGKTPAIRTYISQDMSQVHNILLGGDVECYGNIDILMASTIQLTEGSASAYTLNFKGDTLNAKGYLSGTKIGSKLLFSGSNKQIFNLSGDVSDLYISLDTLEINNNQNVYVNDSIESNFFFVNSAIKFTTGQLVTGNQFIVLNSDCKSIRTNGHLNGIVAKFFPSKSGIQTFRFDIGTDNAYSPATFDFKDITSDDDYMFATVYEDYHPNPPHDSLKQIKRYWEFANNALAFTSYDLTLNYVNEDFVLFDYIDYEHRMYWGKFDGVWTYPSITRDTLNNKITYSTLYTLSDFTGFASVIDCSVNAGVDQSICFGDSATLTASEATSYLWSSGSTINPTVVLPTITTTYYVTGTTGSCTAKDTIVVTVNALPTISISPATAAICIGDSVSLTASGASTYLWSNGATTPSTTVKPTITTTYRVTGTSASGCTNTTQRVVTVNSLPTVSISPATAAICIGDSVSLTASGASTYLWSNGASTPITTVKPTITTTYRVTGTDANGCTNTTQRVITVNALPVANAGADVTIVLGDSTTLTASGGANYIWSNGATTASTVVKPIVTTTYNVTVTNASGCTAKDSVIVTVTALTCSVDAGADQSICIGDSATLTASGASTYLWSNGATTPNTIVKPTITTTYYVTGTTGACTVKDTIIVTVNAKPTISISPATAAICIGDSVSLTASGASTYLWSNGATTPITTVKPTITTTYRVTGTSASGCTNTTQRVVTVNALPTISISPATASICIGDSVSLTASGASTYLWSNGASTPSTTVKPTITTTYRVTGTSASGCTNTTQRVVTVNVLPTISISPSTVSICIGDSVSLTASGASTYLWSNGASTPSTTVKPTITTTYRVTGTSASGCTNTTQRVVTVNVLPTISISPATASICIGDSVSLTASGASTYLWSNGASTPSTTVKPTITTTYRVTGTSASGCINTTQRVVTVNALPTISISPATAAICIGDSVSLTASGASTYLWSNGASTPSTTVKPTITTTYRVTGTSASGCTNTTQRVVTVNSLPAANAGADVTIVSGDSTTLTASGGVNYVWSNGATTANTVVKPTVTTTYSVTATNASGCTAKDNVIVTVTALTCSVNAGVDQSICIGDSATLTASGASTYLWSNGATTPNTIVKPTITTTYYVTGTTGACTAKDTIIVTVNALPILSISPATVAICIGDSVSLTASGASTYLWSNGATTPSTTVKPTITTTYRVTGTSASGCTNTTQRVVTVNALPTISISPATATICVGQSILLTSSGASEYSWSTGATTNDINVSPDVNTTYRVTGTNASGCTNTAQRAVTVNANPVANAGADVTIVLGDSTTLTANGGTAYSWSNGATTASTKAKPTITTTYKVTVTNVATCTATDDVIVHIYSECEYIDQIGYFRGAEVSEDYTGWAVDDINGDGQEWMLYPFDDPIYARSGNRFFYSSDTWTGIAANDVLYTTCFQLDSGKAYELSYWYGVAWGGSDENFATYLMTDQHTDSAIYMFTMHEGITNEEYKQDVFQFVVTKTGNYNIAFHYYSEADRDGLLLDDFYLKQICIDTANAGEDKTICLGNSVNLTATGTGGFSWSTGATTDTITVSPTITTEYTLTYTAYGGCTTTDKVSVTINAKPTLSISPATAAICVGDSVSLTASGASTYLWSNGATTPSTTVKPTITTTYRVTGTNASGCTNTTQRMVTVNSLPAANAGADVTIVSGDSTTLTASGGVNYIWSNGATTASTVVKPTITTTYSVTVTNASGCTAKDNVMVTVTTASCFVNAGIDQSICIGDSATLTASGASTYLWSNGATTPNTIVKPTITTTYYVTGTTGACTAKDTIIVTINAKPTLSISPATAAICVGDSVSLTASGASTYLWSNGATTPSTTVKPTITTTYRVTGTNASGCTNTTQRVVTVNSLPVANAGADVTIVSGDSTTLTASGGVNYIWSNGATTASTVVKPTITTTYSVTVTNASGCTAKDNVMVTVTTASCFVNAGIDQSICIGDSATLTASGASTYLWSNGATTPNTIVKPTITTTYYVTGTTGACTAKDTIIVTINAKPTLSISPATAAICVGDSVSLTASGASTYLWSNGATTPNTTVKPTITTTYRVTGTSASGCTNTTQRVVTVNSLPTVSISPATAAICVGDSVSLTASGASTYLWSNGASTPSTTVKPTITTTYRVTGTSASGCTNTTQRVVTVNALPTISISPATAAICVGDSATLTASGASTYLWSNGATTPNTTVKPTITTTYRVTGTNASGCTNTTQRVVTVNSLPTVSISPATVAICIGDSVSLTASGASTYLWSNGASIPSTTVKPTITTTYRVTGTNASGCTNTTQRVVTVNSLPTVSISPATVAICIGDSVSLTASGASTYLWSNGASTPSTTVKPTITTTYRVTGTNASGCTNTTQREVTINALPTTNAGSDQTICAGGIATLIASGASSYSWSNGGSTATIVVSPTVTTTYIVTGISGTCTATDNVIVNVSPAIIVNAGIDKTICAGETVGLTANGASDYSWSTGNTTASILVSPIVTTTYIVTGTSGICVDKDTVIVFVNTPITVDAGVNQTICTGGIATLTAIGANSYSWSNGANTANITISPTVTNTYIVTGTSGTCTATDNVIVIVSSSITVDAGVNQTICAGGTASLMASGASNYLWSNGGNTATIVVSPTITTTYILTGTSGACTATDNVVVNVSSSITVDAGVNQTICAGASATLTAIGASSYSWSNGTNTATIIVSPTVTTTYIVTGTSGTCTATDNIVVNVNSAITVNAGIDKTICNGDEVTLTASGATNYSWNTGATSAIITINPIATTTYYVTGMSGVCTSIDNVIVNVMPAIIVNAGDDKTICRNKSIVLNVSGATTYSWNIGHTTNEITVYPTTNTTYYVTGTSGMCKATDEVIVFVNELPVISLVPNKNNVCASEQVILSVSGATDYLWNNGLGIGVEKIVYPLFNTLYIVTGTDANGCSSIASININVNPLPNAYAGKDTVIMSGVSVNLTATGGINYSWTNGATTSTINVSPTVTTVYAVTVSDANCSAVSNVKVSVIGVCDSVSGMIVENVTMTSAELKWTTVPNASFYMIRYRVKGANWQYYILRDNRISRIQIGCYSCDDIHMLMPDTTYEWQIRTFCNAEGTIYSPFTDIHSFKTKKVTVRISGNRNLCEGQSSVINATGGKYYTWNTGETSSQIIKSPTNTTTYTVTTTIKGVSATGDIVVNVQGAITLNVGVDTTICNGSEILLVATGADNYEWNIGSMRDSIKVKPSITTVYSITGVKGVCWGQDSVKVIVNPSPFANAGPNQTICEGDSVTIIATGGSVFSWDNGQTTHYLNEKPLTTTSYTLTTSIGTCEATDMIVVIVRNINVDLGLDQTICAGQKATINATGAVAYQWNTGSKSQILVVNPITTTTYIVTGYSAEGCTAIDSITVNVGGNLAVSITNDTTICLGERIALKAMPDGGSAYRWSTGSLRQTITMAPKASTTYTVTVTKDGCTGSNNIVVSIVACKDNEEEGTKTTIVNDNSIITVYPNPTSQSYVKISISNPNNYETIELFDIMGAKLIELNNIQEMNTLNIDHLSNAVYFIKISGINDVKTVKIIKN